MANLGFLLSLLISDFDTYMEKTIPTTIQQNLAIADNFRNWWKKSDDILELVFSVRSTVYSVTGMLVRAIWPASKMAKEATRQMTAMRNQRCLTA